MEDEEGRLLGPSDVAKVLGCSTSLVRKLTLRGELVPCARTGPGWRLFDRSDVLRLRRARQRQREARNVEQVARLRERAAKVNARLAQVEGAAVATRGAS